MKPTAEELKAKGREMAQKIMEKGAPHIFRAIFTTTIEIMRRCKDDNLRRDIENELYRWCGISLPLLFLDHFLKNNQDIFEENPVGILAFIMEQCDKERGATQLRLANLTEAALSEEKPQ